MSDKVESFVTEWFQDHTRGENDSKAYRVLVAGIDVLLAEQAHELGTHLQHRNFGEHSGSCKYGDDACPALTPAWEWFGRALDRRAKQEQRAAEWWQSLTPEQQMERITALFETAVRQ